MKKTLFSLLALLAFGLASCSQRDGRQATYAATGKVMLPDGKPAEHALVVFHRVGKSGDAVPKPRGKVAADGTYKLTTYDTDDGAPAGEYQVTVELFLAGKGDEPPTNRLNAKYAKPATSMLTATVGSGPTEIKPIELKR